MRNRPRYGNRNDLIQTPNELITWLAVGFLTALLMRLKGPMPLYVWVFVTLFGPLSALGILAFYALFIFDWGRLL